MKPLTINELKNLAVGTEVCINGRTLTVDKVGRKYLTFKEVWLHYKVDMVRGCTIPATTGHSTTHHVWANKEAYEAYLKYCHSVDSARKTIRDSISRLSAENLIKVENFIIDLQKQK